MRGRLVGAIATVRDQTELEELTRELQGTRSYAEALRAQAHEFANKLHTIGGLLELGWHDRAIAFITQTTREQEVWNDDVPAQIADPGLAALLVGKASVESERGVSFSVTPTSRLGPVNRLGNALATIAGNLIENAFEAVEGQPRREVVVNISDGDREIHIDVRDSSPGVPSTLLTRIFDDDGAVFEVRVPVGARRQDSPAREDWSARRRDGEHLTTGHHHVIGMTWMLDRAQARFDRGAEDFSGVLRTKLEPGAEPRVIIIRRFGDELDAEVATTREIHEQHRLRHRRVRNRSHRTTLESGLEAPDEVLSARRTSEDVDVVSQSEHDAA